MKKVFKHNGVVIFSVLAKGKGCESCFFGKNNECDSEKLNEWDGIVPDCVFNRPSDKSVIYKKLDSLEELSDVNFRKDIVEELSRNELIERLCEYHNRILYLELSSKIVPSDKEIEDQASNLFYPDDARVYIAGAKWLKSKIKFMPDEGFIKFLNDSRDEFVLKITEQQWDTELRLAAENILNAYDQVVEQYKKQLV